MVVLTADNLSNDGCSPSVMMRCRRTPQPQQPRERSTLSLVFPYKQSTSTQLDCSPRAGGLSYLMGNKGSTSFEILKQLQKQGFKNTPRRTYPHNMTCVGKNALLPTIGFITVCKGCPNSCKFGIKANRTKRNRTKQQESRDAQLAEQ